MRVLFLLVLFLCSCSSSLEDRFKPGVVSYKQPEVSFRQLKNGIKVFYLQDDEVPLIRASAMIRGGEHYVPRNLSGLSAALGELMRTGGTESLQPVEVQEKIDRLAATIEIGFGGDSGSASFSCLEEDLEQVMELYSEILRRPAFNTKRLKSWKQKALSSVASRKDDPGTIAKLTFASGLYGEDSTYSAVSTSESISNISWNDLIQYHRKFVQPEHISISAVGRLGFEEFLSEVENTFGDWESQEIVLPKLAEPVQVNKGKLYLVQKPINQTSILIGHIGPPLNVEGVHSLKVFNQLFGLGGFSSKLVSEVRTKAGLAYSVYGALFPGSPLGKFQIGVGTKSSSATEAIGLILSTLNTQLQSPPESMLLEEAKQASSRSFIFRFDSPDELVSRKALLDFYDFPADYDSSYLERIEDVDADSVVKESNKWIEVSDLVIVVVGDLDLQEVRDELGDRFVIKSVGFDEEPIL